MQHTCVPSHGVSGQPTGGELLEELALELLLLEVVALELLLLGIVSLELPVLGALALELLVGLDSLDVPVEVV